MYSYTVKNRKNIRNLLAHLDFFWNLLRHFAECITWTKHVTILKRASPAENQVWNAESLKRTNAKGTVNQGSYGEEKNLERGYEIQRELGEQEFEQSLLIKANLLNIKNELIL